MKADTATLGRGQLRLGIHYERVRAPSAATRIVVTLNAAPPLARRAVPAIPHIAARVAGLARSRVLAIPAIGQGAASNGPAGQGS